MNNEWRIDVSERGAVGDGATLNTATIQKSIDDLGAKGGGTVHVPPGVYLSGTIFLRTGIALELHPAARLLGSPDLADYTSMEWGQHMDRTPWHLLVADHVRDVKICGGGTIDGNGPAFWEPCRPGPDARTDYAVPAGAFGGLDAITAVPAREPDDAKAVLTWIRQAEPGRRPSPMIEITGCENVRISDVHITNSAGWLLHLHNTRWVWVNGVKLTSNLMGPNNDGFDITGCHDVMVSDCNLSCCDDAICLKTTPDSMSCERVTVTNCIIRTRCVALKFGCAETFHDFRQVTFSNCVVHGSNRAVGIYSLEGGTVEDVVVTNIVCDTRNPFMANRPIHIDCRRMRPESNLGKIRNVSISNVVARTDGRILITAQRESPIENLVLRDIQMIYPTVDDPAICCRTVGGGQFSNANLDAREARGVVVAENVDNFVLDNLMVAWPKVSSDGTIECPRDWKFPFKAANGTSDFFARDRFNTERIPDFHVLWGRGLHGGRLFAPLAGPSRQGVRALALTDCDIETQVAGQT